MNKLILLITILFLGGCTSQQLVKDVNYGIDDNYNKAEEFRNKTFIVKEAEEQEEQELFIETEVITEPELPDAFNKRVVLNRGSNPVTIGFITDYIFNSTGYICRVSNDANNFTVSSIVGTPMEKGYFNINYSGDLKGLLNYVSSKTGATWEFSNNQINIFKFNTKTWYINAFPGQSSQNTEISSKVGSGGSGGGAQQSFTSTGSSGRNSGYQSTVEILENIKSSIESFKSAEGSVFLSAGTSSITVTDTPIVLSKINTFVEDINERLGKNINFKITVFNVTKDDTDSRGFNLNAIWQGIKDYNLNLDLSGNSEAGTSSFGGMVDSPDSQLNGTSFVANMFRSVGDVVVVEDVNLSTLPNQVVPFQYANEKPFIESISTTFVPDVGTTTEIEQAKTSTGVDIELFPVLVGDDRLLITILYVPTES